LEGKVECEWIAGSAAPPPAASSIQQERVDDDALMSDMRPVEEATKPTKAEAPLDFDVAEERDWDT
jgi:hypothetical protein